MEPETRQASPQKRAPPPESEIAQPADKKKRASRAASPDRAPEPSTAANVPGPTGPRAERGLLHSLALNYGGPISDVETQVVVVNHGNFDRFFRTVYDQIINLIYGGNNPPPTVINETTYSKVCQYFLRARIDHVYASVTGRRPAHRIPLSRDFLLPNCVSQALNGIGAYSVISGTIRLVPSNVAYSEDTSQRLDVSVSYSALSAFEKLNGSARARGFIELSPISPVAEGSAWWLLSSLDPSDHLLPCRGDRGVIKAPFPEWTPADALLAIIVNYRDENPIPHLISGFLTVSEPIVGIAGLTRNFITNA